MGAPAVETKRLAKGTPPGNRTARRKKRRALARDRGQVFGFSELAGWSFVLESSLVPANYEKSNT
jgi:hypothetical protein